MILKSFDPSQIKSAFVAGEQAGNFAVIFPDTLISEIRDTVIMNHLTRRQMQGRPFFYFAGSAEYMLLRPLASMIATAHSNGSEPQIIDQLIVAARHLGLTAVTASSLRTQQGVIAWANVFSSLQPKVTNSGYSYLLDKADDPKNAYAAFSGYFMEILQSGKVRTAIEKTMRDPKASLPKGATGESTTDAMITELLQSEVAFGLSGRRNVLTPEHLDATLSPRFLVEDYITSSAIKRSNYDARFTAALLYNTYVRIVQTPDSYDSIFPTIALTANSQYSSNMMLDRMASTVQTFTACAFAPAIFSAHVVLRAQKELLEFLAPYKDLAPSIHGKALDAIAASEAILTKMAFSPIITLANQCYDYVKKLTGARYLLPSYLATQMTPSSAGSTPPFRPLSHPGVTDIPSGYNGFLASAQRVDEFGGFDIPYTLQVVLQKAADMQMLLGQMQMGHSQLVGTLTQPSGSVWTTGDDMQFDISDPKLGAMEPPKVNKIYLTPSFVPTVTRQSNNTYQWYFQSKAYKAFFPLTVQLNQTATNFTTPKYAWDADVQLQAAPSTGIDMAVLPIPLNYVDQSTTSSVSPTIAQVKTLLDSSPHRPMKEIADFFTPLFHSLTMGVTKRDVAANALAGLGLLLSYDTADVEKADAEAVITTPKGKAAVILPTLPYVYGAPTRDLIAVNLEDVAKASHRIETSLDGKVGFLLHKYVPVEKNLRYFPFILFGGFAVALPIRADHYATALKTTMSTWGTSSPIDLTAFSSSMLSNLTSRNDAISLSKVNKAQRESMMEVIGWSRVIAPFPHVFFTNQVIRASGTALMSNISQLTCRRVLSHDAASPFGSLLSYYDLYPEVYDISDQQRIYESDQFFDLLEKNRGQGVSVTAASSAPPRAPDPVNVVEVKTVVASAEAPVSAAASDPASGNVVTNAPANDQINAPIVIADKDGPKVQEGSDPSKKPASELPPTPSGTPTENVGDL